MSVYALNGKLLFLNGQYNRLLKEMVNCLHYYRDKTNMYISNNINYFTQCAMVFCINNTQQYNL